MLLDILITKQRSANLSDRAFADKLGVSRRLWQFARYKDMDLSERLLRGVLKEWPELDREVLLYLRRDTSEQADDARELATSNERS